MGEGEGEGIGRPTGCVRLLSVPPRPRRRLGSRGAVRCGGAENGDDAGGCRDREGRVEGAGREGGVGASAGAVPNTAELSL